MKVIVNKKDFIQSLSLGSSFSGKNKALSALDYTRLVFNGNRCRVTSNDGEMAITTTYMLERCVEEQKEYYVEAKTLINAIRSIKEDAISIEFDDSTCVVNHSRGVFNIPLMEVDVYPVPTMDKDSTNVSVSSELLFNWMKEARLFVAEDELRPVMNGVYLYIKDNSIGVCASDGHRLYTDSSSFEHDGDVDAILSSKAIATLLDTINNTETTKVYFGDRNVAFRAGNTSIMCRKIDGRYPNFNSVIPKTHAFTAEFVKADLIESLSRCLIMANTNCLVKMSIGGLEAKFVAEDIDFSKKGEEFVSVQSSSTGPFEIGFKGTFAKVCLDVISSDNVVMELTDATRAIVMKDANNECKTILLMPMACQ